MCYHKPILKIGNRNIGSGHPVYLIAEISANHNGSFEVAAKTMEEAKRAGADAVKLQTYTPDTMTLAAKKAPFLIQGGTPWDGQSLHELYQKAYTPWEWHEPLFHLAQKLGLDCFSTAFDFSSVDFLEKLRVPVHKVASFELVDLPLIEKMAQTGKPLILSTGMATEEEIRSAVATANGAGAKEIALLKCTSAYPAPANTMHLQTIPDMARRFNVLVGLSDHTLGSCVPVAAVALGACIVEKHFILSRSSKGPDSGFSLEPDEFKRMAQDVRSVSEALGKVNYGPTSDEKKSLAFRRSLFVVAPIKQGEKFTAKNVRSIRPSNGLSPKHYGAILGKEATREIEAGTPLQWGDIKDSADLAD